MSLGVLISIKLLVLKNAKRKNYISTKYPLSFFSLLPQIATYTSSSALSWRIVKTGDLPLARRGLRAAVVENVLFVSGGSDSDDYLTAILSWDPLQEKWTHAGDLESGGGQILPCCCCNSFKRNRMRCSALNNFSSS